MTRHGVQPVVIVINVIIKKELNDFWVNMQYKCIYYSHKIRWHICLQHNNRMTHKNCLKMLNSLCVRACHGGKKPKKTLWSSLITSSIYRTLPHTFMCGLVTEITEKHVAGLKSWGVTSFMEVSFTQSSCFSFLIFPLWRSISRCKRSISFLWWSISSWWCCFSAASCSCSLRLRRKLTGWKSN